MKKTHIVGGCIVSGTILAAVTGNAFADTVNFHDINTSYAKEAIQALASQGILTGDGHGKFRPSDLMTREEFAIVLAQVLKLKPDTQAASKFSDVDTWAAPFVGALVDANITNGKGNGKFGGRDPIKREELAAFFVKALGADSLAQQTTSKSTFKDESTVTPWAKQYVTLANTIDLFHGSKNSDGTYSFGPKTTADRQSVALLGYQLMQNMSTYTDKITAMDANIAKAKDILDKTTKTMDALTSYHMNMDIHAKSTATNESADMGMDADLQQNLQSNPKSLLAHANMNVNLQMTGVPTADQSSALEMYTDDQTVYMSEDGGKSWTKSNASDSPVDLGSLTDTSSMEQYKLLAPLLNVQDQGSTYTLTGTISEEDMNRIFSQGSLPDLATLAEGQAIPGDVEATPEMEFHVTYVIDKDTYQLNEINMQMTVGDSPVVADIKLSNYNQVQPITIPQAVLDAKEISAMDSSDTGQDTTSSK